MSDQSVLSQFLDAVSQRDISLLEELFRAHPEATGLRDSEGQSILHVAAAKCHDHVETLDLILKQGIDINVQDSKGHTPLHCLVMAGGLNGIRHLLARGADVNASGSRGVTPLHCAALLTNEFSDLLVDHGARVNSPDSRGCTPIMWAAMDGNLATARRLWERRADRDVFMASALGDIEFLLAELDNMPQGVHATDCLGNTALHWGAWNGQLSVCSILISRGCDVDARNDEGKTPLHVGAARYAGADLIQLLAKHAASVDPKDKNGRTPLHYAASTIKVPLIAALLKAGANANAVDVEGRTPLDVIISKLTSDISLARYLIENMDQINRFISIGGNEAIHFLKFSGGTMNAGAKQLEPEPEAQSGDAV